MPAPIETAAAFAALVDDARSQGEAPINSHVRSSSIRAEHKNGKVRIVGTRLDRTNDTTVRLSVWQPTEAEAVADAIARAFC